MKREFIGLMGKLSCELEQVQDVAIVRVEGEADVYTSPELIQILETYLRRGEKKILLDAEKLRYLDSATVAGLLNMQKKLKNSGGSLKLLKLQGEPLKVFQMTGMLDLFDNFPEREAALKSFADAGI